MRPTSDGGYVMSGHMDTNIVIKVDAAGIYQWSYHSHSQYEPGINARYWGRETMDGHFMCAKNIGEEDYEVPSSHYYAANAYFEVGDNMENGWGQYFDKQTSHFYGNYYWINALCEDGSGACLVAGQLGTLSQYGGSASPDFFVVKMTKSALGIQEASPDNNGITAYPNPMNDMLTISSQKSLPGTGYQIVDALGRTVLSGKMLGEQCHVATAGLQNGIYTLCIGASRLKLVKQD